MSALDTRQIETTVQHYFVTIYKHKESGTQLIIQLFLLYIDTLFTKIKMSFNGKRQS